MNDELHFDVFAVWATTPVAEDISPEMRDEVMKVVESMIVAPEHP